MMQIFWHDLKSYRRSTIIWAVSLSLLALMFLAMFPSFTNDIDASRNLLSNLPPAVRDALGISLSNFFTIFGFFGYFFTFVSVAGAIQAMNLGVGVLAKESSGKMADFLLAKPVSRSKVLTQKVAAAVLLLVITNLVFSMVALCAAMYFSPKHFDVGTFLLIAFSLLFIQLVFMALGIFFAVFIARIKSVIAVTLPTVFAFFIVSSVGSIVDSNATRYVTPFKYFDPAYITQHRSYDLAYVGVAAGVFILALALSYLVFNKKDINSVV